MLGLSKFGCKLVDFLPRRAAFAAESIEFSLFGPNQLRIHFSDGDES